MTFIEPMGIEVAPAASEAESVLIEARDTIKQRGTDYDAPGGERSMAHCVAIFNVITGRSISEHDGWLFMESLKLARMMANPAKRDTYVDRAAYVALGAECALTRKEPA